MTAVGHPAAKATPRHRTASTEIEQRILTAALRILDEQGEAGLTVRGIAQAAGIAPMGIYSRFEGKTGIYEALFMEGFDRLGEELDRHTPTDDVLADLRNAADHYRQFALKNPAHYRLMFMDPRRQYRPSMTAADSCARTFQRLISLIERGQHEGVFPPAPAVELAQMFWSVVHGFVSLELRDLLFTENHDEVYDRLMGSLVSGLAAPAHL